MASTVLTNLRDRANYLPVQAQALRQRIATLYDEAICLHHDAVQEERRSRQKQMEAGGSLWDLIGMYPDDICGYAAFAKLRVPKRYPPTAVADLQGFAIFELPGVIDWYLKTGKDRPKMRQYLETIDYLRLLTLDYILKYDDATKDLKSF